jgi:predicted dehydrogenase
MTVSYDVVGCGSVVQRYHLPILRVLRDRKIVAFAGCYDPDQGRARELAETLGAERSGEAPEPAAGDGVDAALIATPPSFHGELGLRYVEAGKAVLLEKPATRGAAELSALLDAARAHGARVAVNQHWRYHPALDTARRFLAGRLGEVSSVSAAEGGRWAWPTASSYVTEDPFGGVIHDWGSHLLDSVLYMLGLDTVPPESVSTSIVELSKQPAEEPSHECVARIVLGSEGAEVDLTLSVSRLGPLPRGVYVRGDFGVLFVPPDEARTALLRRGGEALRLAAVGEALVPHDVWGCFLLGHEEFAETVAGAARPSKLDGDRFRLLMQLLETLWDSGPR